MERTRAWIACFVVGLSLGSCGLAEEPNGGAELSEVASQLSLGSTLNHNAASGSTCGLANEVTPSCATSTASDMSFEWTAPSSGTFTFTTTGTGTNFNTVLQIANHSSPGTVLGCNNDANASTTKSTVSVALTSGTKVLVQLDGYASLCGNYQLGISKNCATSCTTPPPCHAPQGSCSITGTCLYASLCGADEVCRTGRCVPRCTINPSFPC